MKVLRTPDERFENLPGYAFTPHYATVDDTEGGELRIHYLEEGPEGGAPVLLMHGEPSWSYLYRKMIPPIAEAGYRVLAPDLVGFGRSDKPTEREDYTYARHVAWMQQWLDAMAMENITLVCQDWGGLIGLRLVAANPDRFARVLVANTGLPTGEHPPTEAFLAWQKFSQEVPEFPVGKIIAGAVTSELPPEIIAAYDAPFPDENYKAGARQFPVLVPTSTDNPAHADNVAAWEVLKQWDKPFMTAFSDSDPVTAGGEKPFQQLIPGAQGQAHTTIEGGGHFLQEDRGEKLAEVVLGFIAANPAG